MNAVQYQGGQEHGENEERRHAGNRRPVLPRDGGRRVSSIVSDVHGQDEECTTAGEDRPEPGADRVPVRQEQSGQDGRVDKEAGAKGVEPALHGPAGNAAHDVIGVVGEAESRDDEDHPVTGWGQTGRRSLSHA